MAESQEILFAQTLETIKKAAKEQGNCISQEEVEKAFEKLQLSPEQLSMVFDYLKKHKIGIGEPVNLDDYLTESEANYLEFYMQEVQTIASVKDGEKEAITLSAMAGDRDAQNRLAQLYLPQVIELAKLYTGQGVFIEDLIGEGNLAVAMGVSMLGCLEHASEAEGMLGKMIMDAMEEIIAMDLNEEKTDKKVESKVNRVAQKAHEMAELLNRKVTLQELAQEEGMSEKAIREAIVMSGYAIDDIAI